MKVHEYQAKELFRRSGVSVPDGMVAHTPDEAAEAFRRLGSPLAVVKAQIHAGGRGKGKTPAGQSGIQLVRSADQAGTAADRLLGHPLVTIQTGPEGKTVGAVLVEKGSEIAREIYLAVVLDRAESRPLLMACGQGGVEIETLAVESPELIHREYFHPAVGLHRFQVRKLCQRLGLEGQAARDAQQLMPALCRMYVQLDCTLAEINPLIVTDEGRLLALDAKLNFDDNALFRHPDVAELRDLSEEPPAEVRAQNAGLSYVKLEGNIGCLVNGAGLAMSTMDLIKLHGGQPANFLDVGGGANVQQVTEAFRILVDDKNVQAVLVNIFGGIMRCTTIATALVEAYKTVGFNVPLVVRLEGTEVEEGREIISASGADIISATGLTDAAQKVVGATKS